jgi:hypothetical protein
MRRVRSAAEPSHAFRREGASTRNYGGPLVRQSHLQTLWQALGAGANEHPGYWPALGVNRHHGHRAVVEKAVAYGLISSSYRIQRAESTARSWLQAGPRGISDCSSTANGTARSQIRVGGVRSLEQAPGLPGLPAGGYLF